MMTDGSKKIKKKSKKVKEIEIGRRSRFFFCLLFVCVKQNKKSKKKK
jgi:hypothetical protein